MSKGMAYHKNLKLGYDVTLPIRVGPVRFGVVRKKGLSSNAWGVYVEPSGDVYLVCRDHMKETKVSLHQSGQQHFGFTSESGLDTADGGRFWDEWSEPQFQEGSKIVPSYSLLFPSWALGLTQAMRDANPKVWNKNQVFVEAAETPDATIVSLVITDSDVEFTFKTNGESQSFPLAILPVTADRKLWVIARQGPERNMRELAERGIREYQMRTWRKSSGISPAAMCSA